MWKVVYTEDSEVKEAYFSNHSALHIFLAELKVKKIKPKSSTYV